MHGLLPFPSFRSDTLEEQAVYRDIKHQSRLQDVKHQSRLQEVNRAVYKTLNIDRYRKFRLHGVAPYE
jgi:hypothetical protein